MKNSLLLLLLILFVGCNIYTKEVHIIDEIDVFETPEDNIRLCKSLIAYDFTNELIQELGEDVAQKVLGNIAVSYFVEEPSRKTTIRLTTSTLDKQSSDLLLPFYREFIIRKKGKHFDKREPIIRAELLTDNLLMLIDYGQLDSLWTYTSPKMLSYSGKDDFINFLKNRKPHFTNSHQRNWYCTRLVNSLDQFTGEFYSINHLYKDGYLDEMVFELSNNEFYLLGYTTYVPNS